MFRTRVSLCDALLLALLLLCTLLLFLLPWLLRSPGATLEIVTPAGSSRYALSVDRSISVKSQGQELTVQIKDGAASVTASTCPDGVCRATGRIQNTGDSIICAPAGVRISVVGKGGDGDVDFVVG